MMSPSTRADLTELLDVVGSQLNDPHADPHAVLLHVTGELARLLAQDIDERELEAVLGDAPTTPPAATDHPLAPGQLMTVPGHGPGLVLAVLEGGALLKVRVACQIRHLRRIASGWAEL